MFRQQEAVAAGTALPLASSKGIIYVLLQAAITLLLVAWLLPAIGTTAPVTLLTINGAIGPANAEYVEHGLVRAVKNGSQLVILKMDTPGGLDTSMRVIIKAILTSPVPVAAYVAPGGARAASAGTYILYASHIAAMAPGTNLGAATPVQIGAPELEPEQERFPQRKEDGREKKSNDKNTSDNATTSPMTRKHVNDAAAYIRGLAQMRGRNADWAEQAVREAVSLPADEALKLHVIDYIAADVPTLAAQLHGKKVSMLGQDKLLQTKDASILDTQPDWHVKLLATITNPNIALLLLTIGIYGLIFEFMIPGATIPGVVGTICLLLALYALQLLPVNYAGLALILLGMAFIVAEAFLPSFGALGLGGIAAFVAGALMLIDTDLPGYGIPLALIGGIAAASALLLMVIMGIALKTRRRAVTSGPSELIGSVAEVVEASGQNGWAYLQGANWRVISKTPLLRGQQVRVLARKGLVLEVAPADNAKEGE